MSTRVQISRTVLLGILLFIAVTVYFCPKSMKTRYFVRITRVSGTMKGDFTDGIARFFKLLRIQARK